MTCSTPATKLASTWKASRALGRAILVLPLLGWAASACKPPPTEPMRPLSAPLQVETQAVDLRPMPSYLALYGALVADQRADVAANVAGRIARTFVERGDRVVAGATLVQVDISGATFSAKEAQANLDNAEVQDQLAALQCSRNQALFDKGAISKDEWDRISSQCRAATQSKAAARARVGLASKIVADSRVAAPFAGTISERYINAGEYVMPSSRVATLVALDPLRLQLSVAEADLGRVALGQHVEFSVVARPGEQFAGTVRYIDPAVRADTRDLRVDARVDNPNQLLSPGMSAAVRLQLADAPVLAVPEGAVRDVGQGPRAFVVVAKRVQERALQLGTRKGGFVAVLDGLRAGEHVIVTLTDAITDGVAVL